MIHSRMWLTSCPPQVVAVDNNAGAGVDGSRLRSGRDADGLSLQAVGIAVSEGTIRAAIVKVTLRGM